MKQLTILLFTAFCFTQCSSTPNSGQQKTSQNSTIHDEQPNEVPQEMVMEQSQSTSEPAPTPLDQHFHSKGKKNTAKGQVTAMVKIPALVKETPIYLQQVEFIGEPSISPIEGVEHPNRKEILLAKLIFTTESANEMKESNNSHVKWDVNCGNLTFQTEIDPSILRDYDVASIQVKMPNGLPKDYVGGVQIDYTDPCYQEYASRVTKKGHHLGLIYLFHPGHEPDDPEEGMEGIPLKEEGDGNGDDERDGGN